MPNLDATSITGTHAACGNRVRVFAAAVRDPGMVVVLPGGIGVILPTEGVEPGTLGIVVECEDENCPSAGLSFVKTDLDALTDHGLVTDPESGALVHSFEVPHPV